MSKERSDNIHANRTRQITRKKRSKEKKVNFTRIFGLALMGVGVVISLYTFDMVHSAGDLFQFPDFSNMLGLWPLFIVIVGFIFVLKDVIGRLSKQSWNSKK